MKLYLKNVNISNNYKDLLYEFTCNKKNKTIIYSVNGIFELHQDSMYILKSCDFTPDIIKIDKLLLLIVFFSFIILNILSLIK